MRKRHVVGRDGVCYYSRGRGMALTRQGPFSSFRAISFTRIIMGRRADPANTNY